MSTYINVVGGDGGLLEQVKAQQQAARLSFMEQQRLSKLQSQIQQDKSEWREQGRGLPVQSFKRELTAHRHLRGLFTMHAVSASNTANSWDYSTFIYALDRASSAPSQALHTPFESYPGSLDTHWYLYRTRYLLLPIDDDASIFVVHWQTASALTDRFTGNLTAHTAKTYSECYCVGRKTARKLAVPSELKARLDYVYPELPLPATSGGRPWRSDWVDDPLVAKTDIAAHGLLCGYGLGRYDQPAHGTAEGSNRSIEYSGTRMFSPGVYTFLLDYRRELDWRPSDYSSYSEVKKLLPPAYVGSIFVHADLQWKDPGYYLTQIKQIDAWAGYVQPVNTGTLLTIRAPSWRRTPKRDVKTGSFKDLSLPSGWSYSSSFPNRSVYMATNWGAKGHCLGQLNRLGFVSADFRP